MCAGSGSVSSRMSSALKYLPYTELFGSDTWKGDFAHRVEMASVQCKPKAHQDLRIHGTAAHFPLTGQLGHLIKNRLAPCKSRSQRKQGGKKPPSQHHGAPQTQSQATTRLSPDRPEGTDSKTKPGGDGLVIGHFFFETIFTVLFDILHSR